MKVKKIIFSTFIFTSIVLAQYEDYKIFENGDLTLPFDNYGSIGQVNFDNTLYTYYKNIGILNAAGFYLSGYTNGNPWSNSVFYAHNFRDYVPGLFEGDINDSRNQIYVLKSSDPDFGTSWQEWKKAVDMGAKFYDGDSDGIYDPKDLNGNGSWDPSEDRPDLIGDFTAWCTYSDKKPSEQRKFTNVIPQGIQIRQTLFASSAYRDQRFGDVNGNNVYDAVDVPLDSATVKNGTLLGEEIIPGAANLGMTSFTGYVKSLSGYDDPNTIGGMRNYLLGARLEDGTSINVSTYGFGNGNSLGADTNNISPYYLFSGDPTSGDGWLCIGPSDWRMLASTGPFDLVIQKPVVILFAINIGQGTSNLGSVTDAKNDNLFAQQVFENNFDDLVVSVDQIAKIDNQISPTLQIYPNPFNGQCTVSFNLPSKQFVKLSLYNVLGQKIEDLVENFLEVGSHQINLNMEDYSTGIYIINYQLESEITSYKLSYIK